jgi:peptidylprolyl isomerase
MQLQLQGQDGQPVIVRVTEITEEHVRLDANPPLAGKELTFDLELVTINA